MAPYGGNFTLPDEGHFAFQHDVTPVEATADSLTFTVFDNENRSNQPTTNPSAGIQLTVTKKNGNFVGGTASLGYRLLPPSKLVVKHIGSHRRLSDNHNVVGWGDPPQINEYDADHNLIYTGLVSSFNTGATYRSIKAPWVGRPTSDPGLAAVYDSKAGTYEIYMSWNGATEIANWAIYTGATADARKLLRTIPKNGFETSTTLGGQKKFVRVQALDSAGKVLGTSKTIQLVPDS